MSEEKSRWEEEAAQAAAASRQMKRRILVVGAVILAVLLLLGGVVVLLEYINAPETPTSVPEAPIYFYPSEPDVNIMEEQAYLDLDRRIYYTARGETFVLTEENLENYGSAVKVLKQMLDCIIAGDHEGYNALFSSNYYATEGNTAKEDFTMQRVYNIRLEQGDCATVKDTKTGKTYTRYEFIVKYNIARNDGTFRRDIGSDEARKQQFVLSNSTGEAVLIDQINHFVYAPAED